MAVLTFDDLVGAPPSPAQAAAVPAAPSGVLTFDDLVPAQAGVEQAEGQGSRYEPGVLSDDPRYWPPQEPAQPWWRFGYGPFSAKAPGPERGTFVPLASGPSGKVELAVPGAISGPFYEAPKAILEADPRGQPSHEALGALGPEGMTAASAQVPVPTNRVPVIPKPMLSLRPDKAASSRVAQAALEDTRAELGLDTRYGYTKKTPWDVSPEYLEDSADKMIKAGNAAGQDVRMFDVQGPATQGEARRSADMSRRAETNMVPFVEERWKQQAERVATWMRNKMGNPQDAYLEMDQIKAASKDPKAKAYQDAYKAAPTNPDYNVVVRPKDKTKAPYRKDSNPGGIKVSLELSGVMQSDTMKGFARSAEKAYEESRVAGLTAEHDPIYPFGKGGVFDPNNLPLEYWDYIKREMDDEINKSPPQRQLRLSMLRKQVVDELDKAVPIYKTARGIAAAAFDAGDAVEAGQLIARNPRIIDSQIDAVRKITPAIEWGRVQTGFLTEWLITTLKTGDRQDLLRRIAHNPLERRKLAAVLGPDVESSLEAVLYIEDAMQKSYRALIGGSMTPRRKARMHTPSLAPSAVIGAAAWFFASDIKALLLGALLYGARKGEEAWQRIVADRVADKLISKDPKIYREGIYEARPFLPNLRDWVLSGSPNLLAVESRRQDSRAEDLPENPKDLQRGQWYRNNRGEVLRWDGEHFVTGESKHPGVSIEQKPRESENVEFASPEEFRGISTDQLLTQYNTIGRLPRTHKNLSKLREILYELDRRGRLNVNESIRGPR